MSDKEIIVSMEDDEDEEIDVETSDKSDPLKSDSVLPNYEPCLICGGRTKGLHFQVDISRRSKKRLGNIMSSLCGFLSKDYQVGEDLQVSEGDEEL